MPQTPVTTPDAPTLRLQLAGGGDTLQITLTTGTPPLVLTVPFASPITAGDAADARWVIEDFPRLHGDSAANLAERIAQRFKQLGQALGEVVFGNDEARSPLRSALAKPETLSRLQVLIQEPPGSPWLPWELLSLPGQDHPLVMDVASFARSPVDPPPAITETKSKALRILLVICRPQGEEDVPFRSVASRIVQAALANPETPIRLDILRPPTFENLAATLAAATTAGEGYTGVHFDGHGVFRASAFNPAQKRGYLRFEDDAGGPREIPGTKVGELLKQHGVRWLLLNACRSAFAEPCQKSSTSTNPDQVFGSLAEEVRRAGVPGVLAMGYNLYVVTAARLVADTYAALTAGHDLAAAVNHARRQLYQSRGEAGIHELDWLVPVVFVESANRAPNVAGKIPALPVGASAATPWSARVLDVTLVPGDGLLPPPFYGYDEVLLQLDRICARGSSAELTGVAGVGKTTVAYEYARWWTVAGGEQAAALILAMEMLGGFQEFQQQLAAQWQALVPSPEEGECLIVLEDAEAVLAGDVSAWSAEDQDALREWISGRMAAAQPLLLSGRGSSGLAGVSTVPLCGLKDEARWELAASLGLPPSRQRLANALMQWSQGVPGVIAQLPLLIAHAGEDDPASEREFLFQLMAGKLHPPQVGLDLIAETHLAFYDPRKITHIVIPYVMALFQGYLTEHSWKMFTAFAELKGLKIAMGGEPCELLHREMAGAVRAGLACREGNDYWLHPLGPLALEPGFAGTLQALTRGNPDSLRQYMGALWVASVQSVTDAVRLLAMGIKGLGTARQQRLNLLNAAEISLRGEWWGLVLPLLHDLREALLLEGRAEEWQQWLDSLFAALTLHPPDGKNLGAENVELQIVRFLMAEAERTGDAEQLEQLSKLRMRIAHAEDVTIEPVDKTAGHASLDVGRIHRLAALLKRGDALVNQGSIECALVYEEALRLARDEKDELRGGEAELALARAYLHVPALYDPKLYEQHARNAVTSAQSMGVLGADLLARAKLSVGNAIMEGLRAAPKPDPARLKEALDCLNFALTATASDAMTRATAQCGLGNAHTLRKDARAAAEAYLLAVDLFEQAGKGRNAIRAQAQAARALKHCGKIPEAKIQAALAVQKCANDAALLESLRPLFEEVLVDETVGG